jgi:hypothetical protein
MTQGNQTDQAGVALKAVSLAHHHRRTQAMYFDGWKVAGVGLFSILVSPALMRGTRQDWVEGFHATLHSSPLLAWLIIPLRRSDDQFDETNRRRAKLIDTLAIVLLWTWPWTCGAPLVAVVRWLQMLQSFGS